MKLVIEIDLIQVSKKKLKKLSAKKVAKYAVDYDRGDRFPPIQVDAINNDYFTIRDGRHRYQAQRALDWEYIEVEVMNR